MLEKNTNLAVVSSISSVHMPWHMLSHHHYHHQQFFICFFFFCLDRWINKSTTNTSTDSENVLDDFIYSAFAFYSIFFSSTMNNGSAWHANRTDESGGFCARLSAHKQSNREKYQQEREQQKKMNNERFLHASMSVVCRSLWFPPSNGRKWNWSNKMRDWRRSKRLRARYGRREWHRIIIGGLAFVRYWGVKKYLSVAMGT